MICDVEQYCTIQVDCNGEISLI